MSYCSLKNPYVIWYTSMKSYINQPIIPMDLYGLKRLTWYFAQAKLGPVAILELADSQYNNMSL